MKQTNKQTKTEGKTSNKEVDYMKEMEGTEVWTNAFGDRFGERVCVGIEKGMCLTEGKKFKPTKKEVKELWDDMIYNEFGSAEKIQKDADAEFGTSEGGKEMCLECIHYQEVVVVDGITTCKKCRSDVNKLKEEFEEEEEERRIEALEKPMYLSAYGEDTQ